jgi:hypothetical protein
MFQHECLSECVRWYGRKTMKRHINYRVCMCQGQQITKQKTECTIATSMLVTRSSSSGQTRYPRRTHSRYDVTLARSWALWEDVNTQI